MIEVSLAIRSVLENELPKMVRRAISESLYELATSSADPVIQGSLALKAKASSRGKKKKIASGKESYNKKNKKQKNNK